MSTEDTTKATGENMEALTLEEDAEKSKIEKNIYSVSTEYAKKEISENVEALRTEDDYKYAIIKNMVPVWTEEDVEYTSSDFDIYSLKFPREDEFLPWMPLTKLLYHFYSLILSCEGLMPVGRMLTSQALKYIRQWQAIM